MKLDERIELVELYEIYGSLLTDKQRRIFEMYYDDDYSINEICEVLGITKNGVYNSLKATEQKILNYEQKLEILTKYRQNCDHLQKNNVSEHIIKGIK